MRKSISIVIGILLLLLTYFGVKYMISSNQKPTLPPNTNVNSVFVQTVANKDVAIQISASGNIVAKNKIELYSEVQGVLVPINKEFKPGTSYQKGETILKIDNQEHLANLQAQKSNLFNSIASIMPDLVAAVREAGLDELVVDELLGAVPALEHVALDRLAEPAVRGEERDGPALARAFHEVPRAAGGVLGFAAQGGAFDLGGAEAAARLDMLEDGGECFVHRRSSSRRGA